MYYTVHANPVGEWGALATLARENTCAQASHKFPLRHGCICGHTACMERITCMPIFIASAQPRHSVIKLPVALESLVN